MIGARFGLTRVLKQLWDGSLWHSIRILNADVETSSDEDNNHCKRKVKRMSLDEVNNVADVAKAVMVEVVEVAEVASMEEAGCQCGKR